MPGIAEPGVALGCPAKGSVTGVGAAISFFGATGATKVFFL